jgi:hypothetical protein
MMKTGDWETNIWQIRLRTPPIGINNMKKPSSTLSIKDFAGGFGADEAEVESFCGELAKQFNFSYTICSRDKREELFLDAIKKCDSAALSVSGEHRKGDWIKGWNEVLQDFKTTNGDLKTLAPKYWHGDRPLRYLGNYIISNSNSFERDFVDVFRHWLYQKYFTDYKNVYEFGCGTGYDLTVMARLFPGKRFFGLDWVPQSQELLTSIAAKYGWPITGHNFDFFHPDNTLKILPESTIYTSSALEQLGSNFEPFLDYLFKQKPELCINVECIAEYYDENRLFDYVALKYHKTRNYLNGFLTRLRQLEKEKKIDIIATRRTGFGSQYHEGLMYVIWKIR